MTVTINNIIVSAIKTNSVTITWDSPDVGTSEIEYGLTTFYDNITIKETEAYYHTTTIFGLYEGTTYNYRIKSIGLDGIEVISSNNTFTTKTQLQFENTIKAARTDGQLPKTYYVSPTGLDTNNGLSTSTPFQHPSFAVNKTDVGDIVYLMDGTYINDPVVFPRSGIDISPISLIGYNGTPTMDGTDNSYDRAWRAITTSGRAYITIKDITIHHYNVGLLSRVSNHINIDNVVIHNTTGEAASSYCAGIQFMDSNNCIIQNCHIHDNGGIRVTPTGQLIGQNTIGIWTSSSSTTPSYNMSVINNIISDNPGTSQINGSSGHNLIDIDSQSSNSYVKNISVIGNTLHHGGPNGFYSHNGNSGADQMNYNIIFSYNNIYNTNSAEFEYIDNLTVLSNNMYDSTFGILKQTAPGQNHQFINNIIWNCSYDAYINNGTSSIPKFVNNDLSFIYMTNGNVDIINHKKLSYQVRVSQSGMSAKITYTNCYIFSTTGTGIVTHYPDRSEYISNQTTPFSVTKYPISARPSSGSARFVVTMSNTLLSNTVYNIKINNIQTNTITTDINGTSSLSLTPLINDIITVVDQVDITKINVTITSTTGSDILFTFGEVVVLPCPTPICNIIITQI